MKKRHYLVIGIATGLLAAAILHFLTDNEESDKPPKKAPQVPIHNPGEQSEFTTSASESEIG